LLTTDNQTEQSGRDAVDLYLAAKQTTEKGPVTSWWEESLIEDVVNILERHPVRFVLIACIVRIEVAPQK
jgi:hypothetical protein